MYILHTRVRVGVAAVTATDTLGFVQQKKYGLLPEELAYIWYTSGFMAIFLFSAAETTTGTGLLRLQKAGFFPMLSLGISYDVHKRL